MGNNPKFTISLTSEEWVHVMRSLDDSRKYWKSEAERVHRLSDENTYAKSESLLNLEKTYNKRSEEAEALKEKIDNLLRYSVDKYARRKGGVRFRWEARADT